MDATQMGREKASYRALTCSAPYRIHQYRPGRVSAARSGRSAVRDILKHKPTYEPELFVSFDFRARPREGALLRIGTRKIGNDLT